MKRRFACKGRGACCQYVGVPMGFYPAIGGPDYGPMQPQNAELWATMPAEAKETYIRTQEAIAKGEYDVDGPCCWLDRQTQLCRFYEFRPTVCRECKPGWHCISLRKEYRVGTASGEGCGTRTAEDRAI